MKGFGIRQSVANMTHILQIMMYDCLYSRQTDIITKILNNKFFAKH